MLIVGDRQDPHVDAVLRVVGTPVSVIDAGSFASQPLTLTKNGLEVDGTLIAGRGWIRRLAPTTWVVSDDDATVESARRSAGLSTLAAVLHDERITWLSPIGALGVTENKPFQYRLAADAGAPVPEWLVTTDPTRAPRDAGWVTKPLGPGGLLSETGATIVPTTAFRPEHRSALSHAPFLLQRSVEARMHARVVTVCTNVYSASLDARGLPLDWRLSEDAHRSFTPRPVPDNIAALALAVAHTAGLGYSAQDWIRGVDDRWWFVDLNPAGQWLFLPEPTASKISRAIANFLTGAA